MSIVSIVAALEGYVDSKLKQVFTMIPGEVLSYDVDTQSADVQPLVQQGFTREDGSRGARDLPPVLGAHVMFLGMTFPVEKGDGVALIFSQASLDTWGATGGKVDPKDDRHHDPSDAIAIPGLNSFKTPNPQVADGAWIIPGDDIRLGSKDATEKLLLGDAYASAESTWLTALDVFLTAVSAGLTVPIPALLATYKASAVAFKNATIAAKATKVKAE